MLRSTTTFHFQPIKHKQTHKHTRMQTHINFKQTKCARSEIAANNAATFHTRRKIPRVANYYYYYYYYNVTEFFSLATRDFFTVLKFPFFVAVGK